MMLYRVLPGGGLKPCDALPPTHVQIHNCATFTLYMPATIVTPRMEAPFYGLVWGDVIVDVASAANFADAVKHFHAPLWRAPHHPEPAAEKRNVRRRVPKKVDEANNETDTEAEESDVEASESAVDEDDGDEASIVQDESEDAMEEYEEEEVELTEEPLSPVLSDVGSDDDDE